jgi:hypothetical protein
MAPIFVNVLINENGGVDKISHSGDGKFPTLEKELQNNLRVQTPAGFNGKTVPSFIRFIIDVPEFVR